MTVQYNRQLSLVLANSKGQFVDVSQMRCTFQVYQAVANMPKSAEIRIYNLSDDTIQKLIAYDKVTSKPSPDGVYSSVTLQAGYPGLTGILFTGDTIFFRNGKETPTETFLHISAVDSFRAYSFSLMNTTLASGYKQQDVNSAIAKAYSQYNVVAGRYNIIDNREAPRGKVMFGQTYGYVRDFDKTNGTHSSIANGRHNVLRFDSPQKGEQFIDLSATLSTDGKTLVSSIIGWPEQTPQGIIIRCLLRPDIELGNLIKIDNKRVSQQIATGYGQEAAQKALDAQLQNLLPLSRDGMYRVMWVEHIGDTRGVPWYTTLRCVAAGTLPPPTIEVGVLP